LTQGRRRLGQRGESLAADWLVSLGYEICARNYRCRAGEIDLVARYHGRWVFVEVRTRRGDEFGTPEQSITPRKRRHLIASAQSYLLEQNDQDADWRIDAVAVVLAPDGQVQRVDIIENAVTF
jgi:putative endonuclease